MVESCRMIFKNPEALRFTNMREFQFMQKEKVKKRESAMCAMQQQFQYFCDALIYGYRRE